MHEHRPGLHAWSAAPGGTNVAAARCSDTPGRRQPCRPPGGV